MRGREPCGVDAGACIWSSWRRSSEGSQLPGGAAIHVRGHFTAAVYTNPISCVFTF